MGTSICTYARTPRTANPKAESIHIRQSTSAHVITNVILLAHLKSAEVLIESAHSTYNNYTQGNSL